MTEAQQTILDKALAMEPERDETTRKILAEAQEQFSRFGLRRTSM